MGGEGAAKLVLLRFSGDIHIKARATRHQFVRRLIQNLRDALTSQGLTPRLRLSHNRIFVELPPHAEVDSLTRVFGIQSISVAEERSAPALAQVVRDGEALFREEVRGRRFAVRARRVGSREKIPISARDVERELGAALLPVSAGVDLDHPEVTAFVELMDGHAYFFRETRPAQGGLPLGVEGRAVALLSGGFDSAVAAWQLLKRGVAVEYVFCNLGGATHRLGVLRVARLLAERWHHGHRPLLHAVDFEEVLAELRHGTSKRYWQILLKRLMLRAAERIARERHAVAIVTGEAVGQVSSQTLQNLAVISKATDHMILRPLVGTNKEQIIEDARRIGTFDLSRVVGEYCDLVPQRPATAASLEAIEAEETRLCPATLERAVAKRSVYDLRGLRPEDLELPELEIATLPDDAVLIDLRGRAEYEAWHHPDALRLDFPQALQAYPSFDPERCYVLYCDYGLMSAHLAELMRKAGFRAFHFRGGTRALRNTAGPRTR